MKKKPKMEFVVNRVMSKQVNEPDEEDYTEPLEVKIDRWLSRANSGHSGGWLKFVRLYNKIMTRQQSAFLQDLMNRAELARTRSAEWKALVKSGHMPKRTSIPMDGHGWFRCSVRYLTNPKYDSWTIGEQDRHFRFLTNEGYIWTQIRKNKGGATRWVKINFRRISEGLDRAEKLRIEQMVEWKNDPKWKKPKLKGE